jgi:hypothetical protein
MFDFKDLYILYDGHPRFNSSVTEEDDIMQMIIQKYEVIIFTNQGEVFGEPNLGANLESLIFQTNVSAEYVQKVINDQIIQYIPEIGSVNYEINCLFTKDPFNYQDILYVNFKIGKYDVYAQLGVYNQIIG